MTNPCAGLPLPAFTRALTIYARAHPEITDVRGTDWEQVARIAREQRGVAKKQDAWRKEKGE
jgi:hypothetical protein